MELKIKPTRWKSRKDYVNVESNDARGRNGYLKVGDAL